MPTSLYPHVRVRMNGSSHKGTIHHLALLVVSGKGGNLSHGPARVVCKSKLHAPSLAALPRNSQRVRLDGKRYGLPGRLLTAIRPKCLSLHVTCGVSAIGQTQMTLWRVPSSRRLFQQETNFRATSAWSRYGIIRGLKPNATAFFQIFRWHLPTL